MGGKFCYKALFTDRFALSATRLLFALWEDHELPELEAWLADLAQLTLCDQTWWLRVVSTNLDNSRVIAIHRGLSNALEHEKKLMKYVVGGAWQADDKVSFAPIAVRLHALGVLRLTGAGTISPVGAVLEALDSHWELLHALPSVNNTVIKQPFDAALLALLSHNLALGTRSCRELMQPEHVVSSNCRTGNTSQLRLCHDKTIEGVLDATWVDSRRLRPLMLDLVAKGASVTRLEAALVALGQLPSAVVNRDAANVLAVRSASIICDALDVAHITVGGAREIFSELSTFMLQILDGDAAVRHASLIAFLGESSLDEDARSLTVNASIVSLAGLLRGVFVDAASVPGGARGILNAMCEHCVAARDTSRAAVLTHLYGVSDRSYGSDPSNNYEGTGGGPRTCAIRDLEKRDKAEARDAIEELAALVQCRDRARFAMQLRALPRGRTYEVALRFAPHTLRGYEVGYGDTVRFFVSADDVSTPDTLLRPDLRREFAAALLHSRAVLCHRFSGGKGTTLKAMGIDVAYVSREASRLFAQSGGNTCEGALRVGRGAELWYREEGASYFDCSSRRRTVYGDSVYYPGQMIGAADIGVGFSIRSDDATELLDRVSSLTAKPLEEAFARRVLALPSVDKKHGSPSDHLIGFRLVELQPALLVSGSGVVERAVVVRGVDYMTATANSLIFANAIADVLEVAPADVMVSITRAADPAAVAQLASLPRAFDLVKGLVADGVVKITGHATLWDAWLDELDAHASAPENERFAAVCEQRGSLFVDECLAAVEGGAGVFLLRKGDAVGLGSCNASGDDEVRPAHFGVARSITQPHRRFEACTVADDTCQAQLLVAAQEGMSFRNPDGSKFESMMRTDLDGVIVPSNMGGSINPQLSKNASKMKQENRYLWSTFIDAAVELGGAAFDNLALRRHHAVFKLEDPSKKSSRTNAWIATTPPTTKFPPELQLQS